MSPIAMHGVPAIPTSFVVPPTAAVPLRLGLLDPANLAGAAAAVVLVIGAVFALTCARSELASLMGRLRNVAAVLARLDRWSAAVSVGRRALCVAAATAALTSLVGIAGADVVVDTTEDGETSVKQIPDGARVVVAYEGRGADLRATQHVIAPDERKGYIVRLHGTAIAQRGAVSAAAQPLQAQHDRVVAEIRRLVGASRLAGDKIVRFDYRRVLNGLAVDLPQSAVKQLERHPDVAAVYPDVEVKIVIDTSAPHVGAPEFREATGYSGAGQVIAILDTGVDYTHPSFGSCLMMGGGCRVIGGYDFYNLDDDPMDDHGHGTHVAGIAAGEGDRAGMAPEADLLAYKVLSAYGSGNSSGIIAALEQATIDGADVINLSLGGRGDADDPLSVAVDNATLAGAVVVVAAGNSGGYLQTASPGTSRSAVTVGATDDDDQEAHFTSGGPSPGTYEIKPELSAPGVAICAALAESASWPPNCGDGYTELSGTSMATPHVAGAAALLRGLRPALTPAEIKSLLVNASSPLAGAVSKVGTGRLDIVASGAVGTVITPATISLGRSDPRLPVWSQSRTLTIRNDDTLVRAYTLTPAGAPVGVTIDLQPSQFELQPGHSILVDVEVSVDTDQVPVLSEAPYLYDGIVRVESAGETLRVPWAFVHAPILGLEFDRSPVYVMVHNGSDFAESIFYPQSSSLEFLIPSGTYDVIVSFDDFVGTLVIREQVLVEDGVVLNISSAEAVHRVRVSATDEDGNLLPSEDIVDYSSRQIVHHESGIALTSFGPGIPEILVSPTSDAYGLSFAKRYFNLADPRQYFMTADVHGGIDGDHDITFDAADLAHVRSSYVPRPDDDIEYVWNYLCAAFNWGEFCVGSPFIGADHDLYVAGLPGAPSAFTAMTGFSGPTFRLYGLEFQGGQEPGEIDVFSPLAVHRTDPLYVLRDGEDFPIGAGPAVWRKRFSNAETQVSLMSGRGNGAYAFAGQGGEPVYLPDRRIPFHLAPEGQDWGWYELRQYVAGTLWSGTDVNWMGLTPEPWRFETAEMPYFVGGMPATTKVEASFDLTREDANPPWMARMVMTNQTGELTDRFSAGDDVVLLLEAHDDNPLDVSLHVPGHAAQTIAASDVGEDLYRIVVPDPCVQPNQGIPALLQLRDAEGNELIQNFNPLIVCREACAADSACDDGSSCTADSCVDGQCESLPLEGEGCCSTSDDCSDGDSCTLEQCSTSQCQESDEPICCAVDPDCDDGNFCTEDQCGPDGCSYSPVDCDDGNECTADACGVDGCEHTPVETPGCGWCSEDAQCDDGDPCTDDICDGNSCEHTIVSEDECENEQPVGLAFHPIEPCRAVDTRVGRVPRPLRQGEERSFVLSGVCGIPSTAQAVSAVITVVGPSVSGYLTLFPADEVRPGTSAVNYSAGIIRNNNLFLKLSSGGDAAFRAYIPTGETHFVFDVNGYFE